MGTWGFIQLWKLSDPVDQSLQPVEANLQKEERISADVFHSNCIYSHWFVNSNAWSKFCLFFSSGYSEPQWPPASGKSLERCVPPGGQAEAILWIFAQVRWVGIQRIFLLFIYLAIFFKMKG